MQKLLGPRHGVYDLTFSPDGDMLAGVGPYTLYCWTRSRGWEQSGLRHPFHHVTSAAFHPTGQALAYGLAPASRAQPHATPDEEFAGFAGARLYSLTAEKVFEPDRLPVGAGDFSVFPHNWVAGVAFTPDGRTLVANQLEQKGFFARTTPAILHWCLKPSDGKWKAASDVPIRTEAENGAALIGNEYLVLAGAWGVRLCPLDSPDGGPVHAPGVAKAQVVATSPRGELVATGEAGKLWVWSLRAPAPVAWWAPPEQPSALAFSPDGRVLAVGDAQRGVAFCDPLTGTRGAEFDFGVGPVQSLAYAPDRLTLAVAGRNGLVVVDVE